MNSTHAHFNISAHEIGAKLKPHGTASGYSQSSGLAPSVFKKHRFQIAPPWRAFSNGSVFGDRFRRCSVDDNRIRTKTAPFSFENGLVWTGPKWQLVVSERNKNHDKSFIKNR